MFLQYAIVASNAMATMQTGNVGAQLHPKPTDPLSKAECTPPYKGNMDNLSATFNRNKVLKTNFTV